MDVFVNRLEQIPGFKYIIFGAKALIENFVETGSKELRAKWYRSYQHHDFKQLHRRNPFPPEWYDYCPF